MFEIFDNDALLSIAHAQDQARLLHFGSVGTGELLLGLVAQDQNYFLQKGLTLDMLRAQMQNYGDVQPNVPLEIPFTSRAKHVFENIHTNCSARNEIVTCKTILVGILSENGGVAVKALQALGIKPEELIQSF